MMEKNPAFSRAGFVFLGKNLKNLTLQNALIIGIILCKCNFDMPNIRRKDNPVNGRLMSTIVNEVYEWIKQKLIKGDFSAGQRVSQRKLAREFGCSPMPVAEAMRRLESEGLLVKEPLKIPRIRQISAKEMEGLYLVREGLEGVAARLCALRITEADQEKLKRLGREFEKAVLAKDQDRSSELDVEIHRFIMRGADCPLLLEEIERLRLLEMTAGGRKKVEPKSLIQRHKALIQAISDRDGDFAEYMAKRHVRSGYEEILQKGHGNERLNHVDR